MDKCEQAVDFLAGPLHDYEKIGLDFLSLMSNLIDTLDRYIWKIYRRHRGCL